MASEFGIYSEEGLVERDFYSRADAEKAIREHYSSEDGLTVEIIAEIEAMEEGETDGA